MKLMFIRNRNVLNTKWLVQFINALAQNPEYEISVVCDTYKKVGSGLEFDSKVKLINLSGKTDCWLKNIYHRIRCKIFPPFFRYKNIINKEKPDIIICYFPVDLFNVTTFQNHDIPIILMMHGYPPALLNKYKKGWYNRLMRFPAFSKVSVFQVLLNSYIQTIDPDFAPKKIVSIANMVGQLQPSQYADLNIEKKKIVYIARIEKNVKRPHLLVEAFGKIAQDFPDWSVDIWGLRKYPQYEAEILDIAKKYHIENRVSICGYSNNVLEIYQRADIHAFPSAHEGFALTIADGQAAGLPTLGFASSPSVNELIIDGHNGLLAADLDDFAQKLALLMKNKNLRIEYGRNAIEDTKKYAPENIIAQWKQLFKETAKERK